VKGGKYDGELVQGLGAASSGIAEVFLDEKKLSFKRWRPGKKPNKDPFGFFIKVPWLEQFDFPIVSHKVVYSEIDEGWSKDHDVFFLRIRVKGESEKVQKMGRFPLHLDKDRKYVGVVEVGNLQVRFKGEKKGSEISEMLLARMTQDDLRKVEDGVPLFLDCDSSVLYERTVKVLIHTKRGIALVMEREKRLSLPGGRVMPGEDSFTAIVRECKEEMMVNLDRKDFRTVSEVVAYDHLVTVMEYIGAEFDTTFVIWGGEQELKNSSVQKYLGWIYPKAFKMSVLSGDWNGISLMLWSSQRAEKFVPKYEEKRLVKQSQTVAFTTVPEKGERLVSIPDFFLKVWKKKVLMLPESSQKECNALGYTVFFTGEVIDILKKTDYDPDLRKKILDAHKAIVQEYAYR